MTLLTSRRAWIGFEVVFRPWMRRRFAGIHVRLPTNASVPSGLPILLVANHVSWWDGFLLREVHRRMRPEALFHVVMAEKELRRWPFLRWLGAVPLGAGPMAARSTLRSLDAVCGTGNAVIGYFPQGKIWPSRRRPLGFRRGGDWLAGRLAPVTVCPVALHIEPLNRSAPSAFVLVGSPVVVRRAPAAGFLESRVTRALDELHVFLDERGETAATGWGPR